MDDIKIKLSYWTYSEGTDFVDINNFKNELSKDYKIEVSSKPTDGMGGGLYEVIVEIISSVDFADIIKDYVEDGIKISIGFFWRPILKKIKELFKKNKQLQPDIEIAKFIFNDIEIIIYPLYVESVSDVIEEIIVTASQHFMRIKDETKETIKSIHIPIFNQVDTYEVCAYRVKLNVDENIASFSKEDYFKFWGIKCDRDIDFIYDLNSRHVLKTKFYTQAEYDILLDKKFNAEI